MSTIVLILTAEIAAPAPVAWQVLADYSRDVEWRRGVRSMVPNPEGAVHVGTTTTEELKVAGRTYRNDGEVTRVDPGVRFEWRTTAGVSAHGARDVAPVDSGRCRVQLEFHVTPTGVNRLVAPVLRRMLDRGLVGDLERLRALVEAEAIEVSGAER
jgi:uncharacterized membrane protein